MLKVFETFAGIGSQTKALQNIGVNHKVVAISEWNINSIISYAYIHYTAEMGNFILPEFSVIKEYLSKYTFSNDGKDPIKNIFRIKPEKLLELYKANILTNNFGSILDINGKELPDIDLLTYSFPCQAISTAGSQKGFKKDSGTSSSLLWEIERILLELKEENRLPSYLLMENVSALLNRKNNKRFLVWLEFLASLGYSTKTDILVASHFNVPQCRERAFAVSVLNKNKYDPTYSISDFHFPKGKITSKRIVDILDNTTEINPRYLSKITINDLSHNNFDIPTQLNGICKIIVPSIKFNTRASVYLPEKSISPTLVTELIDHPKILIMQENPHIRTLIPIERMRLMGFSDTDFNNLKKCSYKITDDHIIYQCGNSIVVDVLMAIFTNLFKEKYSSDTDLSIHFT